MKRFLLIASCLALLSIMSTASPSPKPDNIATDIGTWCPGSDIVKMYQADAIVFQCQDITPVTVLSVDYVLPDKTEPAIVYPDKNVIASEGQAKMLLHTEISMHRHYFTHEDLKKYCIYKVPKLSKGFILKPVKPASIRS